MAAEGVQSWIQGEIARDRMSSHPIQGWFVSGRRVLPLLSTPWDGRLSVLIMRTVDLIQRKRDGEELAPEEIRVPGERLHQRRDSRLPDVGFPDGRLLLRDDRPRGQPPDRVHAAFRRNRRSVGHSRREGRQAFHRRRGRQDQPHRGAAGRSGGRGGADDVGPRAGPHRRHAGQAGIDPRLPHRPDRR